MAKITPNRMFIDSMSGPDGELYFAGHGDGTTLAKHRPTRRFRQRTLRQRKSNPFLLLPNNLYADCDAWSVADATYTDMSDDEKQAWRFSIGRPGNTAYDVYMRQAIPHLLRGYPAPDLPDGTTGWPVKRLFFPEQYVHGRSQPGCTAIPPASCLTQGLHYAAVAWRKWTWLPDPEVPVHWEIRYLLGFHDGHPKHGDYCHFGFTAFLNPVNGEDAWHSDLWASHEGALTLWCPFNPHFLRIEVYPDARDDIKDDILPIRSPDYSRGVIVQFIDQEEAFVHWPRAWPSRKADAIPADTSLLTVWEDSEFVHYGQKGE
jgi:hypothetical protein